MDDAKRVYDRQRQKVYDWENATVAPNDKNVVPFEQIQSVVNHVWTQENLKFPPEVKPIAKHNRHAGTATRLEVEFHEKTKTWIILHELAHSMTSIHTGETNQHGALFMGVYCKLLAKYLGLNGPNLVESARQAGLAVKDDAAPVFLDD